MSRRVTTAASAGACVPAARPPASECLPRRPGRFVLSESSVVPEICLLFLSARSARRFGLKRFDSVTFCFPICRSCFNIYEMILFEVFFLSPLINYVLTISTNSWLDKFLGFCSVRYDVIMRTRMMSVASGLNCVHLYPRLLLSV